MSFRAVKVYMGRAVAWRSYRAVQVYEGYMSIGLAVYRCTLGGRFAKGYKDVQACQW